MYGFVDISLELAVRKYYINNRSVSGCRSKLVSCHYFTKVTHLTQIFSHSAPGLLFLDSGVDTLTSLSSNCECLVMGFLIKKSLSKKT